MNSKYCKAIVGIIFVSHVNCKLIIFTKSGNSVCVIHLFLPVHVFLGSFSMLGTVFLQTKEPMPCCLERIQGGYHLKGLNKCYKC